MKNIRLIFIGLLFSTIFSGCWLYSFSGASIPAEMKTVNVSYFENMASLVYPSLSQSLTEALKTRIREQTSLSLQESKYKVDGAFEGRITDYSVKPVSLQSNEKAAQNRLSITISVHYICNVDAKLSFEQNFTRYEDFSVETQAFEQQEATLVSKISQQLVEDIFNRAFANW